MNSMSRAEKSTLGRTASQARWGPPIDVVIHETLSHARKGKVQLFFLDGNQAWHCWRDDPVSQGNIKRWTDEELLLIACDEYTSFGDVRDEVDDRRKRDVP